MQGDGPRRLSPLRLGQSDRRLGWERARGAGRLPPGTGAAPRPPLVLPPPLPCKPPTGPTAAGSEQGAHGAALVQLQRPWASPGPTDKAEALDWTPSRRDGQPEAGATPSPERRGRQELSRTPGRPGPSAQEGRCRSHGTGAKPEAQRSPLTPWRAPTLCGRVWASLSGPRHPWDSEVPLGQSPSAQLWAHSRCSPSTSGGIAGSPVWEEWAGPVHPTPAFPSAGAPGLEGAWGTWPLTPPATPTSPVAASPAFEALQAPGLLLQRPSTGISRD